MARSTVNTDGTRLRSSSVKTRPGSATSRRSAVAVSSVTVTSATWRSALRIGTSSASPRAFSASIAMARPRAETTSGGSMIAVSQRV